jgi:hypothetical protein
MELKDTRANLLDLLPSVSGSTNGTVLMNDFEQMKLVYDYIKFHIGLYLATPPVFVIIAESFEVKELILFQLGLVGMIVIYSLSGAHAALFMGRFINTQWTTATLEEFNKVAYTPIVSIDEFGERFARARGGFTWTKPASSSRSVGTIGFVGRGKRPK